MVKLTQSRYVIAVPDLNTSSQYYHNVLGFNIHEIEDPGWRFFIKDHCVIMAGECPDALPPGELGDHAYFAYILVEGIDDYYHAVQAQGGMVIKMLRDEPWQMREFGIRTVDGHRIMFGAPLPTAG